MTKRGTPVSEYMRQKPLPENIVREFVGLAEEDDEFLARITRLYDREYMESVDKKESDDLGRIVNNFFVKFILQRNLPSSSINQLKSAIVEETLKKDA